MADHKLEEILRLQRKQHEIVFDNSIPTVILFIDLSDSTSYKFNNYLPEGISRAYEHNNLASKIVSKYKGKVIKWMGDGLLACFDLNNKTAKSEFPLLCAIDFQRELQRKNKDIPSNHQFHTKIGIHFGNVFWCSNFDVLGKDVDITARIQSICLRDQILVSESYLNKCDLTEALRHLELKDKEDIVKLFYKNLKLRGVGEPITLHAIIWDKDLCSSHKASGIKEGSFIYKNIIEKSDLFTIENETQNEAWIMSPTLEHDLYIAKTDVIANMKRGIVYRYLIPKTLDIKATVEKLKRIWKAAGIQTDISKRGCKAFFYFMNVPCVLNTICVYDPYESNSRAIVTTPTNPLFPSSEFNHAFYVADGHAVNYYTVMLHELMKSQCITTTFEA